jgi:hypothetical protein
MAKYEARWQTVKVEVENGIGFITLNRPEKRNAMSPPLNREMIEVLETLELDDDAQVMVLTGAGDAWTAGMDLKEYFRETDGKPGIMQEDAAAHVQQGHHRHGQRLVLRRRLLAAGGLRPGDCGRRRRVRPVRSQLGHPAREPAPSPSSCSPPVRPKTRRR